MADTASWIRAQISAHEPGTGRAPALLQRLLSARVALAGKGGTVFGMSRPAGGFADEDALYRESCEALEAWLNALEDDGLRAQLVTLIEQHGLEVRISAAVAGGDGGDGGEPPVLPWPEALERMDGVGEIARAVQRLRDAGIDVRVEALSEVPSRDALDAICEPLDAPARGALEDFLVGFPARVELDWHDDETGASGSLHVDLARLPALQKACRAQAEAHLETLAHYYGPWRDALPFLALDDGQGFVALGADGRVRYLDDEGNSDINGVVLAPSLRAFWQTWTALGFLALTPDVLERVRDRGFALETFATEVTRFQETH